jgi:hypothetical protein
MDETTASRAAAAVREPYLDDSYWSVFSDSRPALQRACTSPATRT